MFHAPAARGANDMLVFVVGCWQPGVISGAGVYQEAKYGIVSTPTAFFLMTSTVWTVSQTVLQFAKLLTQPDNLLAYYTMKHHFWC